jgi:hypothetical protein
MITCQHEWVEQCLLKYRFESLPEGEHWEDAHYPLPECLGGTETVKLWSRDHAVQGVLQSEDVSHPCLHTFRTHTDRGLISTHYPNYLDLYDKWRFNLSSISGRINGQRNVERGFFTPGHPNCILSEESQSAAGKKGGSVTLAKKVGIHDPKYLGVGGKLGGKAGSANTNSQRWQCTVTGFISKPGPLTRYQKKRGIDPLNRVRID